MGEAMCLAVVERQRSTHAQQPLGTLTSLGALRPSNRSECDGMQGRGTASVGEVAAVALPRLSGCVSQWYGLALSAFHIWPVQLLSYNCVT
jgi:hypothetical protein